jgi:hypothetical protein
VVEPKSRGVLDTRRSLSSGGHPADPLAGMTIPGEALPAQIDQSPTRADLFAIAAFHIFRKRFMVPRALSSGEG